MTAVSTTTPTTPTTAPAARLPIDGPALLARCMDDAGFAAMVLNKFAAKVSGMADQVAVAASAGDAAALGQAAHALKGAAANLAAEDVREIAGRLEAVAHDPAGVTAAATTSATAALRSAVDRLIGYIPTLVAQLQ